MGMKEFIIVKIYIISPSVKPGGGDTLLFHRPSSSVCELYNHYESRAIYLLCMVNSVLS